MKFDTRVQAWRDRLVDCNTHVSVPTNHWLHSFRDPFAINVPKGEQVKPMERIFRLSQLRRFSGNPEKAFEKVKKQFFETKLRWLKANVGCLMALSVFSHYHNYHDENELQSGNFCSKWLLSFNSRPLSVESFAKKFVEIIRPLGWKWIPRDWQDV